MSIPQHGPQFHKNQSWKVAVRAATTVAGTLATDYVVGAVVDGVTLALADRILVKDAAAPEENGIRVVAASGAPARALDFVSETEIVGAAVVVTEGTTNAMTVWLCVTTPAITVDTTALDFAQLSGGGGGGSFTDAGGYYAATDVDGALQELASKDIGYEAHGTTGSTETFDAVTGWHSATLDANCTFTLTGATSGLVAAMVLELLQDGTGSRLVTWPGSVVWTGGTAPTLSTTPGDVDVVTLFSRDGGTTWYGFSTGGGGGGGGGPQLYGPYAIPEAGAGPGFNDTGLTLTVGTVILQAFLIETSPYTNPTDTGDHVIISVSSVDGIDVRVEPITRYDMFEQGTITPLPNLLTAASDLVGAVSPAIVFQRPAVVLIEGGPRVDINVADPTGVTYDLYLLAVIA